MKPIYRTIIRWVVGLLIGLLLGYLGLWLVQAAQFGIWINLLAEGFALWAADLLAGLFGLVGGLSVGIGLAHVVTVVDNWLDRALDPAEQFFANLVLDIKQYNAGVSRV